MNFIFGFLVGVVVAVGVIYLLYRIAEHAAFRDFWL